MNEPSIRRFRIHRFKDGAVRRTKDVLAAEEPLEIRVFNQPVSVTMRTPGQDAELIAGWLFAEGIIRSNNDLTRLRPHLRNAKGNIWNVELHDRVEWNPSSLRRAFAAHSSCGLCGRESITAITRKMPRLTSGFVVASGTLMKLPEKLRTGQAVFSQTGGLHAAALFDRRGRLLVLREDVGRHNAVDKVTGWGLLNRRLPFENRIMLVSGRASFEIVQKTLMAGLSVLCAVSAPSSLALELSRAGGQTLVGFLKADQLNVYSGLRRVRRGR